MLWNLSDTHQSWSGGRYRGLRGRVEDGKSGGGLCYGYRVVKKLDECGEPIRGDREIDEAQAIVARRIFKESASGISLRAITKL
jgi:site-specific DNA recombinase